MKMTLKEILSTKGSSEAPKIIELQSIKALPPFPQAHLLDLCLKPPFPVWSPCLTAEKNKGHVTSGSICPADRRSWERLSSTRAGLGRTEAKQAFWETRQAASLTPSFRTALAASKRKFWNQTRPLCLFGWEQLETNPRLVNLRKQANLETVLYSQAFSVAWWYQITYHHQLMTSADALDLPVCLL